MKILSRHLLKRLFFNFFATLGIASAAITIAELMLNINDFIAQSEGIWKITQYLIALVIGSYFQFLIPVSAFAAIFLTFGFAARSNELIAMKAGGISPRHAALPLLAAIGVLALAALGFNETVARQCARIVAAFEGESTTGDEMVFRGGAFWYHRGDTIYRLRTADAEQHTLQDVTIYERNAQGRLARTIVAKSALVDGEHWLLSQATVRRFDPANPAATIETALLETLDLALPDAPGQVLLKATADHLSLPELFTQIRDSQRRGEPALASRTSLHQRLLRPFTILLFALLALPLALRVETVRTLATPALQGIALIALYWFLENFALDLSTRGVVPAGATLWLLLVGFAAFGIWRLRKAPC